MAFVRPWQLVSVESHCTIRQCTSAPQEAAAAALSEAPARAAPMFTTSMGRSAPAARTWEQTVKLAQPRLAALPATKGTTFRALTANPAPPTV